MSLSDSTAKKVERDMQRDEARTPRKREDSYRVDFLKNIFDSAKEEDSLLKKLYMYGGGGLGGTTLAGADLLVDMLPGITGALRRPVSGPDALSDREYLAKKAQGWRGRASGGIVDRELQTRDLAGLANLQEIERDVKGQSSPISAIRAMEKKADEIKNNRRQRMMASGGVIQLQKGGPPKRRSRGYRSRAVPEGYGGPQGYQGYGGPATFEQRQEFVAPEVASQWSDITQGVMDTGTRSYDDVRYKGPQVAGFTPQEAAYKAAATSIGTGQGPQATRQAEQTLGDAATGIGGVATAAGSPSLLKDADLSGYMSQYTQGAIDPQLRAIREAARAQQSELGASAAQAGAFGGYRHGLQEQGIGQDMMQSIGDVTAKGYEQAFRSAQEAQQKDAQAESAGRAQELDAYGRLTNVAGQEASLGGQQQRDEMTRLKMMRDAGTDTRKMQQTAYDMQKAEHQKEMQYPEKQLDWMSTMLRKTPYQNITQSAAYTPQGGPMTTMLDAGIADTGMNAAHQANLPPAGTPPENQSTLGLPPVGGTGTPPAGQSTSGLPPAGYDASGRALGGPPVATNTNTTGVTLPPFGASAFGGSTATNPLGLTLPITNPAVPSAYAGGLVGYYGGGPVGHGGIVGMRDDQILARLGGGVVPMYYGG